MSTTSPPAPGQLVDVRQRRFVVLDVQQSALADGPLRGPVDGAQHLLTLSSVEDDALGEELQVVWELEPGARTFEKAALPAPTGFDLPLRLDAFLDAVRWGAVSSADVRALQSPFRSGVEVEEYQLDPVVRALQMPRANLLIADDVGLGKTIEAGLVVQELLLRHRARTVLVLCPASLQVKWQEEMRDKFGLEFRIVDSQLMRDLRRERGLHVNPWTHFPRLITSIDFLKRDRPLRLFREALPAEGEPAFPRRFDVLIIDEAHNVAPSGGGHYATDSQRTLTVRTLAPHFEHKLFLTATPHNGYQESFSALLELLDNQRFARGVRPDREQLRAVMVRRLKSELPPLWDGTPRFPKRVLAPIEVAYTGEERRAHQALREYSQLRQQGIQDSAEEYATEFVLKLLKKRLFSSPAAFAATLEKHEHSVQTARRRSVGASLGASVTPLRREIAGVDEEFADDDVYEETTADVLGTASRLFRDLTPEEKALLQELREYAAIAAARADTKASTLIAWLQATLRPGGEWSSERVIIFTEYRATQKWLQGLLAAHGLTQGDRLHTLYGGMKTEDREAIKAAFQAHPDVAPVRILLATDAASEGIDLQRHCHRLVHYEIPWNPNRMEQRNGRVDRHGQQAKEVLIYHFVGQGYQEHRANPVALPGQLEGDLEFLMRAALKLETIREDVGKVGPVIAEQVEQAMLGRRRTLDTAKVEREAEPVRRLLRFERQLTEQLRQLHDQLTETTRELRLAPENIQAVVEIGLELAGQPPLREATLPGIWPDPAGRRKACPVFYLPCLTGSWAACTSGLRHPHTDEVRPITFDHSVAGGRDDVVLAHLNHRLVQMSLRLLRSEVWSREGARRLHRVTARLVPNAALEAPAVIAHGRLVVLGADSDRLHEEVIAAGGLIEHGRFNRLNVGQTQAALEASQEDEAPPAVRERLAELWPSLSGPLLTALERRSRERTTSLSGFLEERATREVDAMTAVLRELERAIRVELTQPETLQLELFSEPEKEQLERNRASLTDRIRRIPEEIEREAAAIRRRYADPAPRLFPVAVTFLVPERLAR